MTWIQTYTGRVFDFENPDPDSIDIRDIAHALAHLCRFVGHVERHYSVAQHSVLVSRLVPLEYALWGLLHDAAEAYVGDVSRPLKGLLPEYSDIEGRATRAIRKGLGLPLSPPFRAALDIQRADTRMLVTEAQQLLAHPSPKDWDIRAAPYDIKIHPWRPSLAKFEFLDRFHYLYKQREKHGHA